MEIIVILLALLACAALVLVFRIESNLLKTVAPGPVSVLIGLLLLVFLTNRSGLFTYAFSDSLAGQSIYLGYILCICAGFIPLVAIGQRRMRMRAFGEKCIPSSSALLSIALFSSSIGMIGNLVEVVRFGVMNVLAAPEEFHNFAFSDDTPFFVKFASLVGFAGFYCSVILLTCFWSKVRPLQKAIGLFILLVFVLYSAVTGGRSAIFFAGISVGFAGIVERRFSLRFVKWSAIGAMLVLVASTFRRVNYMGDDASFSLMHYFGIVSTILPNSVLESKLGVLAANVLTYIASPLNNFCLIIGNSDVMAPGNGIYSMRFISPLLALVDPAFAYARSVAYADNSDYLMSFFSAGAQWSTLFGYYVLDFGIIPVYGICLLIGVLCGVMHRIILTSNPSRRFVLLAAFYIVSFVSFMMPITSSQAFFFVFISLLGLAMLLRGRKLPLVQEVPQFHVSQIGAGPVAVQSTSAIEFTHK